MPKKVKPSRDAAIDFLESGIRMMQSEATVEQLKDFSIKKPAQKLVELQRAGWDGLNIDQDEGCEFLNRIEEKMADDMELVQKKQLFVLQAQRTYVRVLKDRKPGKLEKAKPMPRESFLDFFDACDTELDLPETIQELMAHLVRTGQVPNNIIIQMQRSMLENLGFEADHGCDQLGRIPQVYSEDKELLGRMQAWMHKAQTTCMRVVKMHQLSGGKAPQMQPQGPPEMMKFYPEAKEACDKMTPLERGELLEKFQKRFEIFGKLPPPARNEYFTKLTDEDKLEFAKVQILMVHLMKQQWEEQQKVAASAMAKTGISLNGGLMQAPAQMGIDGAMPSGSRAGATSTTPLLAQTPVAAPSQQSM